MTRILIPRMDGGRSTPSMPPMAPVLLTLAIAVAAVAQATLLRGAGWAPDLGFALLVLVAVAWPMPALAGVAVVGGLVRDAIDPGTTWFHLVAAILFIAIAAGLRGTLHRASWISWTVLGLVAVGAIHASELLLRGALDRVRLIDASIATLSTVALAVGLGTALERLQRWRRRRGETENLSGSGYPPASAHDDAGSAPDRPTPG